MLLQNFLFYQTHFICFNFSDDQPEVMSPMNVNFDSIAIQVEEESGIGSLFQSIKIACSCCRYFPRNPRKAIHHYRFKHKCQKLSNLPDLQLVVDANFHLFALKMSEFCIELGVLKFEGNAKFEDYKKYLKMFNIKQSKHVLRDMFK